MQWPKGWQVYVAWKAAAWRDVLHPGWWRYPRSVEARWGPLYVIVARA